MKKIPDFRVVLDLQNSIYERRRKRKWKKKYSQTLPYLQIHEPFYWKRMLVCLFAWNKFGLLYLQKQTYIFSGKKSVWHLVLYDFNMKILGYK